MSSVKELLRGDVVDGSGTANYIPKFIDTNTIGNSAIYESSGNIGIGTTIPSTELHIKATSGYSELRLQGASGSGGSLEFYNDSTQLGDIYIDPSNNVVFRNPSERMRIDSSGNVGIGTSSPSYALSVSTSNPVIASFTRDLATDATLRILGDNDGALIDTQSIHTLRFATNDIERMRITSGGDVAINTVTSYGGRVDIYEGGNKYMFIENHNQAGAQYFHLFRYSGSDVGSIVGFNTSTSYNTSSDYRLKENVVPMTGALDRVDALKPSRFNFIIDPNKTVDGFLAHQVQEVVPEAITGKKDAVDKDGNPVYQGIDQSKLVPLLVGAIKELKARIEILENK